MYVQILHLNINPARSLCSTALPIWNMCQNDTFKDAAQQLRYLKRKTANILEPQ